MRSLFILLALTTAASPARAGNWPQFRGPQANGVDASKPAPIQWDLDKSQNILWRTPIPGLGHSSPILWDKTIYVTTAVQPEKAELKVGLYGDIDPVENEGPQQWRMLAIDQSNGHVIWNTVGYEGQPRSKRHPKSSHCNCTPATDGRHIAAIFGSEGLFCFGMDGKLLWHKDLGQMDAGYYVVPSAQFGFASSPVIYDGKIVVLCDVETNSFLAVFDPANGTELWRTPRKDVPTWGTPTVVKSGGRVEILINGWHHTGAYDFVSGKDIWWLNSGGDVPVPTPVAANGLGYFTSAHGPGRSLRAVRLDAKGDITPSRLDSTNAGIIWAKPRAGTYMQTPIIIGENLFACLDNGVLSCLDAKTGELHYQERVGGGSEGFTSSPVSDGRNLFIASEMGNVFVVPAADTFSVIATNALHETCMATPLISEGMLCYRTRDELVAIAQTAK